MQTLIFITAAAFLISLLVTPVIRRGALRIGLCDRPDGQRKLHAEATAVGGGLAILIGFFGAIFLLLAYPSTWGQELSDSPLFLIGFMVSGTILCGIGLIDDRITLRGRQKLAGQIVATLVLMASGVLIENVTILDWRLELGIFAYPITLLWILGAINALNLIDGADGLATSVGLILSLALAGMCFLSQHDSDGVLALVFAGSLAGFLYHNLPPARIFLGDGGSMLIGLMLGALAIRSSLKGPATVALAAPTAIMAIPMFDVAMAVIRRKLTGRSLYAADRGHLHHRIAASGYGGIKTVIFFGVMCSVTALGALVSVYEKNELMAIGAVAAVIGTLVLTKIFGHVEFLLMVGKVRNFLLSLVATSPQRQRQQSPDILQLQGTREWKTLWQTLVQFAERFDLSEVRLSLTLPKFQEEFYATWSRKHRPDLHELWHSEIPLHEGNAPIGKLVISGVCRADSACEWMSELIAGLEPFEWQLRELIHELPHSVGREPAGIGSAASVAVPFVASQAFDRTAV